MNGNIFTVRIYANEYIRTLNPDYLYIMITVLCEVIDQRSTSTAIIVDEISPAHHN